MSLLKQIENCLLSTLLCFGAGSAMADVVVVVSPKSTVTTLSSSQLADIFLGKAASLPSGERAVPVDAAEGSGARNEFYLRYAGKSPAQVKAHWSKLIFTGRGLPPKEVAHGQDIKMLVSQNPHMIGYIDSSEVDGNIKVVPIAGE